MQLWPRRDPDESLSKLKESRHTDLHPYTPKAADASPGKYLMTSRSCEADIYSPEMQRVVRHEHPNDRRMVIMREVLRLVGTCFRSVRLTACTWTARQQLHLLVKRSRSPAQMFCPKVPYEPHLWVRHFIFITPLFDLRFDSQITSRCSQQSASSFSSF